MVNWLAYGNNSPWAYYLAGAVIFICAVWSIYRKVGR